MYVDRRVGSSDLYPLLQRQGAPVELASMTYGDVYFLGLGEHGEPIPVGVERKRLSDLLASLMSGRLNGHQLPGLLNTYKFSWLLVEGQYKVDDDGVLLVPRKGGWAPMSHGRQRFMAASLESWLLTVSLRGGIRIMHTRNDEHTARWLHALYQWWSKPWEKHTGHLALDEAIPERDAMILTGTTLVQKVAAQLPGVGYTRARAVSKAFPTILSMACAPVQQWRAIPGIGHGIASQVVKVIQEGE